MSAEYVRNPCQCVCSSNAVHDRAQPHLLRRELEGGARKCQQSLKMVFLEGGVSSGVRGRKDQSVEAPTSPKILFRTRKERSVSDVARDPPSLAGVPPHIQGDSETCNAAGSSCRKDKPTDLSAALLVDDNPRPTFGPKDASTSLRFPVPHISCTFPIPLFLVQLWLLDWERQQRLTQDTCPLPLRNPSSFCFFSSSLHALASLHSVVDLAHNLAFLRLLQRRLALDGVIAHTTRPPAGASRTAGPGGLASQRTVAYEVNKQIPSTRQPQPMRGCGPEAISECFPLWLYRCLLALNRGRIKGSFCRTSSSYLACACTGLSQLGHLGTHSDSDAQTGVNGYFKGYGGSLLNLLHELAAKSVVVTSREIYKDEEKLGAVTIASDFSHYSGGGGARHLRDAAESVRQRDRIGSGDTSRCCLNAAEQLSHDAKVVTSSSKVVDETSEVRDYLSTLGLAVASSVQALEDEWRLSSALQNAASGPQRSNVVAMYRELMRTLQSSTYSSGYHNAFCTLLEDASSLSDGNIRSQDTHEFLHLLIEETQRECETAERLQEDLKAYLEQSSTLNREICAGPRISKRLPERPYTSQDSFRECRECVSCAPTIPTEKASAGSPSNAAKGADLKKFRSLSDRGGDRNVLPSEFVSCNGSLWSLIPQNQLKSVFVGTLKESLRCLRCGVCSPERSTPFWCIHVTLSEECAAHKTTTARRSSTVTLERLLDVALGPQRLEDVECTFCSASATIANLRGRLGASPLMAAVRMHGSERSSSLRAAEAPHATEVFGHAEQSLKDACSDTATEVQSRLHCENQEATWSSSSRLRAFQGDVEGVRGLTVQVAQAGARGRNALEGVGVETAATHLDDVPGLFSPFWYLPASLVSAWVRIWRLLFRLRHFLMLQGVSQSGASPGQSTWVLTGTKRSACQQRGSREAPAGVIRGKRSPLRFTDKCQAESHERRPVPATQRARLCCSSSPAKCHCTPETDEDLRLAAGDLWIVQRSPKEKLQRVERMPSVLIIQVNALSLSGGGQLHKEQTHCVSPFHLDATFMTRSTQFADSHEKINFSASWIHPINARSNTFCERDERRGMCANTRQCTTTTSVGAAGSGEYGGVKRAPGALTAAAVSDTRRECWCGLYHLYELRAVITHAGSPSSAGHFTCYRRWDAHAFIPGAAWCLFARQFLSSISPAAQNVSDDDRGNMTQADIKINQPHQQHEGGWDQLRQRVRQWLLQAARTGCTKSSFAWISDDCVRPASFAEVQAAQPYLLFYEKVSPCVF